MKSILSLICILLGIVGMAQHDSLYVSIKKCNHAKKKALRTGLKPVHTSAIQGL